MQPVYHSLSPSFPSRGLALFRQLAAALCFTLIASPASAANIIHEFYVPLPEAQVKTALTAIEPAAGIVGNTLDSVISIVVTGSGTVIHYDQWEDGYEIDLNNPTQSTTQIWGDGNDANGIPPGYAHDPASFTPGSVIVLRNLVALPRNPAILLYDGRDRFGGTKALVVSRASWATTPGTVLAGANEVQATMDYGTNFIAPVGDDVSAASMFEYVGMFVMARDDATSVTLDPDGPGSTAGTTFVLNRGESYLFNGGIKKGATVVASKPVQVDLITGDIGARYESRRFTLYARDQWSNTTYSPVGTAANSDASYAFIYNPNATTISINATTCLGTSTFTVAANGVAQWQLAKSCGAKFATAGGEDFFGVVCVGANPSANNVHDWGFSMVPSDNLTSQAVVGWGPGSSDLTQNGSPVWVTPTKATRVYVDYNGDGLGSIPVPAPTGGFCDATLDIGALETRTVYDPDKDGTAMKLFTNDGTTIAVAWGQDPAVAGPALPFLDCGTTVLPFPVPVLKKTAGLYTDTAPTGMTVGDTIEYTVTVDNKGLLPLGNLIVLDPLNASLAYIANSTTRDGTSIADSSTGTPFPLDEGGYSIPIILRGGTTVLKYRCTIVAAGTITNVVNNITYNLNSDATVTVPTGGGSTPCTIAFTNSTGTVQASYTAGSGVYATLTDPDSNTSSTTVETQQATITNAATGDAEIITLTETAVNSGVFRNTTPLPTSTSTGSSTMDGTLLVVAGNTITVTHLDTVFGETCTSSATIALAAQTKILYLNDTLGLDRIDPVATNDTSTASTAVLGVSSTVTNYARSPNLAIPDRNSTGVSDSIVITGATTISDLDISLNITHTYVGDLNVFLTHVDTGTTITLITRVTGGGGGCSGDDILAILDDAAATSVDSECSGTVPAISGTFRPNMALSAFNGQSLNGTWTLKVADRNSQDVGTFVAWQMTATTAGSGGVSTASFVQSPTFASSFTVPAATSPSVTAYYTVSSGTMPASPTITATPKKGSTTLATSSSTSASTTTGAGLFTFNFAALPSAINFAASEAMTLDITTAQSGVTFTVDYDSATKPSKITLPTTTVITTGTPVIYDAPYPGGSPITSLIAGSTAYIRTTASDPFGYYDITSMGVIIANSTPTTIVTTTASVVGTPTGADKTFEYAWAVPITTGTYSISIQANEGSEGINARSATTVGVTQLDLGTPSITEFTTGSNGPGTPTYNGNEQVCVRITDIDQNTNAAVAETITAVITATSGDSELITLTETGINTGIFVYCIPASTTTGSTHNDGTLHAVLGDVLHVVYVDPTDPTDTSDDTATIPNIAPSISVTKTLVTPADGICVVGDPVSFTLQITNTGNTTLSSVSPVDTFDNTKLTYLSASVTPNVIQPTHVDWTNVGPLSPGQSTTITVNFTALAAAAPTTNSVAVTATGGVNASHTANVTITNPHITIAKTLLSASPANVGDNVTFRIVATNDGSSAIATLPIEDTFSGANFEFVSATLTPDASGAGSLLWLDATGAGNLAPAASITIDVTLKAKGAAAPATNLAAANYTVDVNGDSAPPVQSSTTVTLVAATISGKVYDDLAGDGGFTVGDPGLEGITVKLYTDPNGDGDPSDGTLVAIATTDANGAYEFPNLSAQKYVVVESDPPGYSSTGDTGGANDNRIPLDVTTLTSYGANNFFDQLPLPASYGSVAGTVFNDATADGSHSGDVGLANVGIDLVQDTNQNGIADPGEPIINSTLTDSSGNYSFSTLTVGFYVVVEHDLYGWISTNDNVAPNDNQIGFQINSGDNLSGCNFLDAQTGTVSGSVLLDTNNDNVGDTAQVGVTVKLFTDPNADGDPSDGVQFGSATTTDSNGDFIFTLVPPGNYVVVQTPATGTVPAFDSDLTLPNDDVANTNTKDNRIPVAITPGETDDGNTFVNVNTVAFGNLVFNDVNNNGRFDPGTDSGINGVTLQLWSPGTDNIAGTSDDTQVDDPNTAGLQNYVVTTAGGGLYSFTGLTPGSYYIKVAASNFGVGAPLEHKLSAIASATGDDDVGEDGIDNGAPTVNGIRSAVFNTLPTAQPTDAGTETGFGHTADNANDADSNLTIDFGFTSPAGCINQIVNGSFEIDREPARWTGTDSFVDTNNATRMNVSSDNAPAGWTLRGQQAASGGNSQSYWIQDATRAVDGQRFVYMQADQAVATQTFCINGYVPLKTSGACETDFVEGKTYRISFDYAMFDTAQPNGDANQTHELWIESAYFNNSGASLMPPEAPTNGELLRVSGPLSSWNNIQWKHAEIYVTPPVGSGMTYFDLAISSPPDGTKGVFYDNVKFEGTCCEVAVGNMVFKDANKNGHYDAGEGVGGVKLQLFNSNDTPVDDPHQFGTQPYEVITANDGSYLFNGLQPGDYYVRVPASQFASGQPLYGLFAVSTMIAGDDDAGQDGIFNASPETNGIRTATFTLAVNAEPTDATTETGFNSASDNSDDDNANLTIDLGYVCPTISVAPASLASGVVGTPYSVTLSASGGTGAYTYSVSGTLPAGLSLTNGIISGTPTTAGSSSFTITATDAAGCSGSISYTVVVHAATLHGHVYQDTNGNGQQDSGEPDLHDVDVKVGSKTAITDENGDWSIIVTPGSYVIDVDETDADFLTQMTTHFRHLEGDDPETVTAVIDQDIDLGYDGYVPLALVTGHLYFDTNHDGHYQSGEPNLANVDINILDANAQTATVTTDSAGIWSTYLLPGESIASVDTLDPDFTAILGAGYVQSEGDDPTTFIVSSGATNNGGNDGYYYTAPVIHGHAYRDTNGNAQQDSGEPNLANVDVLINNDDTGFNTIVQTDANGGWSATVEQGSTRIFINVNDADFIALVPGNAYIQTVGTNNNVVQPLANQNIDAGTDAFYIPATIKGHLYIDVNGNHTQDSGEIDLRNVDVLITPSIGPAFNVTTDNDGLWTASVPPGSTTANVNELDPDFATNVPSNYILTEGSDPHTITAVANQTTDLGNNGYFNPGTLHGHLYLDTNGNGAQNSGEPNLENVDVIITDANNEPHTVSTNADGDWTIDIRPGSASIEVQTTDPQFPVGVVQSEGTDPNTATVVINSSTDGGTDGYKPAAGIYSISGQVRDDFNGNGRFEDNDTPVAGVTMKLWLDTNNNGSLDSNDALVTSTTTDSNGQYSFSGLVDGNYIVQEIDPHPASSTADVDGANDNLVHVIIAGSNIVARDFLDAVDPAGYIFDSITGAIIPGGNISVSGPGAVTIQMNGSTGQYSFITDGTAGTYTITLTPPTGYRLDPNRLPQPGAFDPTGGADPTVLGSTEDAGNQGHLVDFTAGANPYYFSFDLAAGDPLVINNNLPVVLIKPDTYSYWKSITPGAGTTPTSNNDCDAYNDLLEYALCGSATTAVQTTPLFTVQRNGSTGHFDAVFKRPVATSDVTYDLQVISNLANSPAGWVSSGITPVIVNNNDGSETLTYAGLDISTPINGQTTAFARLKVTQTVAPNASSTTDTFGWTYRTAPSICETFSIPYQKAAIFSGCINSVTGNIVNVGTSAGSVSVKAQMLGGQSYFIEVISGANEGQRWEVDEAASNATSIAIDLSSSLNTKATLPANLATDVISLRPHWQLGELFDKNAFHGTNSALTADRLLFFDASSQTFTIKWLALGGTIHRWVNASDANLNDQGSYIIDNGIGFFVHPRNGPVNLLFSGWVRTNAFARPIVQGNNFVGGGWPVAQSPASRGMSVAGGFTGARSALASDLMQFWAGDTSLLGVGYQSLYLLETATRHQWTPQANASVLNENNLPLFTPLRAFLLKSIAGKPDYLMPRAWTP